MGLHTNIAITVGSPGTWNCHCRLQSPCASLVTFQWSTWLEVWDQSWLVDLLSFTQRGRFLKWGYLQTIFFFDRFFQYKQSFLGTPIFRKHQFSYTFSAHSGCINPGHHCLTSQVAGSIPILDGGFPRFAAQIPIFVTQNRPSTTFCCWVRLFSIIVWLFLDDFFMLIFYVLGMRSSNIH